MSFNLPKFEIPNDMRDFAEKSVDQARKAFDGFLGAAHKAVDTFQGQANSGQASAVEFTRKAIAQAESNVAAAFEHASKLVRARDPQEVMQLQSDFLKSQFAQVQEQMKDLGSAMQANLKDFTASAQENVQKAMDSVKPGEAPKKK
ncbi:MAG: phasin [Rhizobiales bacterium 65-9]|nr:phasin [Hyphomicrobiales bacterium]OJY38125.1 MAG: phasin [Rhizobiales bacterium 65-9]